MSSEAPTQSKNTVLEMMKRRDRERKELIKEQRSKQDTSELEGVDHFESLFDKKVCEIENCINSLQPDNDGQNLQNEFATLTRELQDLQKYFSNSTIFLSDHKIKTSQNKLNQISIKLEDAKSKLLPKKKFGFKNKSKTAAPKVESNKPDEAENQDYFRKEYIYTDSQKKNKLLLFKDDVVNNQDLTFEDLENCILDIKGHAGSIQVLNMSNCLILCGAVSRSVFAINCKNCIFAFSSQQLRLHSSVACDIYMFVTSRAIIEDCKEIRIAPCSYTYENIDQDIIRAGLDSGTNNWEDVGDFNWLSTEMPSPNWSRIDPENQISNWQDFIIEFAHTYQIALTN
jgi:tubulin-specific chaperone C